MFIFSTQVYCYEIQKSLNKKIIRNLCFTCMKRVRLKPLLTNRRDHMDIDDTVVKCTPIFGKKRGMRMKDDDQDDDDDDDTKKAEQEENQFEEGWNGWGENRWFCRSQDTITEHGPTTESGE